MRYSSDTRQQALEAGQLNPHSGWGPVEPAPELEATNEWEQEDMETVVKFTISPAPSPRVGAPLPVTPQSLAQPRILNHTPGRADRRPEGAVSVEPKPLPDTVLRAPSMTISSPEFEPPAPAATEEANVVGALGSIAVVVAGVGVMAAGALIVGVSSIVLTTTDLGHQAAASLSAVMVNGTALMVEATAEVDPSNTSDDAPAPATPATPSATEEPVADAAVPAPDKPIAALNNKRVVGAKVVFNDGYKPSDPVQLRVTTDAEFVSVYVDGQDVGATPVDLELQRGMHHVRLARGQAWGIHQLATPQEGGWCFAVKGEKILPTDCG